MTTEKNPLLNLQADAASPAAAVPAAAQEPMTDDERRTMRRNALIKMLVLLFFLICVVIFGSIAWFTMNKNTGANGMGVKVGQAPFELAVLPRTGAETYYNTNINALGYLTDDDKLSTRSGSIRWVMRDESPITSSDDYKGFRPGSYGSLTFYIVPEADPADSYSISLKMKGYYAEFELDQNDEPTKTIKSNTFQELTDKAGGDSSSVYALAANYMKGHIIFFRNRRALANDELNGAADTSLYYSGRITDSFTFNTADHAAVTWNGQTAYEVTIYWIWPNTFGQILLDNGSENLYGEAMFSSRQSGNTSPRTDLIDYIANHPGYFFSSADLLGKTAAELTTMMNATSLSKTNALLTLSNGYNGADQVIGENVQFILVELTVE